MSVHAYPRAACVADATAPAERRRPAPGFTFIGVLVLLSLAGLSLTVVGEVWRTKQRRERESELLYVGAQFRRAITSYNAATQGAADRFPRRLADLVRDPRYAGVRRHLRKIYRDPITGSDEWGLVRAGEYIVGIYSLSEDEPIKKSRFAPGDKGFEGKAKYRDWVFLSSASAGVHAVPPAAIPPRGDLHPALRRLPSNRGR